MNKDEKDIFDAATKVLRRMAGNTPDFMRIAIVISHRDDDGSEGYEEVRRVIFNCCPACAGEQFDNAAESLASQIVAEGLMEEIMKGKK